jgi:glycosyltransferase 2 family protein
VAQSNLLIRFRKWLVVAIAFGAMLYLGGSVYADWDKVSAAMGSFQWWILLPVCGLTLVNYTLRFLKWRYLTRRLGVRMPFFEDAWNFTAGLAMIISPGKVGELLKPYVVRERTGVPMATTTPALVTERLTDAIGMLILAAISVSVFLPDKTELLITVGAVLAFGLLCLAHEGLSLWVLRTVCKLPVLDRIGPKLEEMLGSMRSCVAPVPLLLTVGMSIVAWFAECWGFMLVFEGLGVQSVTLEAAIFVYAFATLSGAISPGGLGLTEVIMAALSIQFIMPACGPELTAEALESCTAQSTAIASAATIIIRICTLWIGVAIGAVALFKVSSMLGGNIALGDETDAA